MRTLSFDVSDHSRSCSATEKCYDKKQNRTMNSYIALLYFFNDRVRLCIVECI